MSSTFWKSLLVETAVLLATLRLSTGVMAAPKTIANDLPIQPASQLLADVPKAIESPETTTTSDVVSPGEWQYTALQGIAAKYGCNANLNDRPVSKVDLARDLNACLDQIESLLAQDRLPSATSAPDRGVTQEDLEVLRKLTQEFRAELTEIDARLTRLDQKLDRFKDQQFSTTTKLAGEAIFGLAGATSGDFSRNTTFGYRTRLELHTSFTGTDLLTTRLQAVNQGLPNNQVGGTIIPAGSLAWTDGTTNSGIKIDLLNYQFSLSPQTSVVLEANVGQANDFTDTLNPLFDGNDGASGSISLFGTRAPIFYTVQGAGAGIRHKLNDKTELSLGYLARTPNNPTPGNGLFNGGYGALAQLTFQTSDLSKVALTYVRGYNSDSGTGSINANLGGNSDNFGVEGFVRVSPKLTLGGWVGYTNNQLNSDSRQIWNWAVTAAMPDLGGEGNLAGLLVGQEPWVAGDTNNGITTDTASGLHLEGFYQFKVNDNLSITPGMMYIIVPDRVGNSPGTAIGVLRTTFTF